MDFPYPLLVCDIGGTNARIATVPDADSAPELLAHLKTADFPGLPEAVESVGDGRAKARSLIACGAGPVSGRSLHLTNAAWTLDGPAILKRLELEQGLLLNDFEAQALSLPALKEDWLRPIGGTPAPASSGAMRLILGPGTGLGVAGLYDTGGRYLPLSSEGGHIGLGPVSEEEEEFWPYLEKVDGRNSAESILSGPGLVRLHCARLRAAGQIPAKMDGVTLVDRALHDPKSPEARTVQAFWRLAARFSGDMALAFLARGGVTLGGGVLPRMVSLLNPSEFRSVFEAQGPMADLARQIPTALVVAPDAVLAGMAAIAAAPARYLIDYQTRCWA